MLSFQNPNDAWIAFDNEAGEPVEALAETVCRSIGLFEERLAELQAKVDGGKWRRVFLRSLFKRS